MGDLKIILMYPNFKWASWMERTVWSLHPYSLGILAAMVEDKYNVKIIDGTMDDLSREQFAEIIQKEKPDVLGISVLTNEYGKSGFVAAEIAKKINPNIKTVFGGVHATTIPDSIITNSNIDFVVVGEGEYVFRDLCDYFAGKGELPKKGILYKKNGEIINTGRADFIFDLDKIPFPSYKSIDFAKYANTLQRESVDSPRDIPYARIITSRGCPYNCCFCSAGDISGKKMRMRSVENILEEIEMLIKNYGIKAILFDDDNFIYDKERAKKLFKAMIEKSYSLKWNAPALALYKLDEEMIELMRDSGCQYVDVAVESGVERVLYDIIHKPLDLEYGKKMLKKLKEAGIYTVVNFILGFPGETWEEIRQNLKFAEEIDVDYVKIAIATPLPNTELYRIAKENNYLMEGFRFDRHLWTDGWIKTKEFRPEDLKILRAYEWDRINFTESKKRKKTAEVMRITEKRLSEIRKSTLERANPNQLRELEQQSSSNNKQNSNNADFDSLKKEILIKNG